jgi:Lrp/AsnC family leucine-responsive transcriptional regulator
MEKLDLKDYKILYELDLNSRQSFKEIGNKVGLSKDSIIYRINQLKEKGVIKGFHTVFDVGKLGFTSFRVYLKLEKTNQEKEEEMINFLVNKKIVTWVVSISGEYDLGFWILSEKLDEMNRLWKELFHRYRDFIEKSNLAIFTKISYFSRNYLSKNSTKKKEYIFVTEPNKVKLDKKDLGIINLLSGNSRVPILEISQKLKMTPKTAASRINQLEKDGVIVGYRTMFDLERLGYEYFKVHFNLHNLTGQKGKQFMGFLFSHPNVIYNNEVIGGDDVEIEIQTESLESLRKILNEIKNRFSDIIKNYKYLSFYKEHKYIFFPKS